MADDGDLAIVSTGHAGVTSERRRLVSLAYRLTGTLSDAEDVVQETYVRRVPFRTEPHTPDSRVVTPVRASCRSCGGDTRAVFEGS